MKCDQTTRRVLILLSAYLIVEPVQARQCVEVGARQLQLESFTEHLRGGVAHECRRYHRLLHVSQRRKLVLARFADVILDHKRLLDDDWLALRETECSADAQCELLIPLSNLKTTSSSFCEEKPRIDLTSFATITCSL